MIISISAFAFEDMEFAWCDHGGLPNGLYPRIRLAAIREQIDCLELDFKSTRPIAAIRPRAQRGGAQRYRNRAGWKTRVEQWLDLYRSLIR